MADAVARARAPARHDPGALDGWPLIKPAGGWSLLIDAVEMGTTASELSRALIEQAAIAATPMTGWGGEVADRHVRLVFSAEPVERLETIRERVGSDRVAADGARVALGRALHDRRAVAHARCRSHQAP